MEKDQIRTEVRKGYAAFAQKQASCCGPRSSCGCGGGAPSTAEKIGYERKELSGIPEGADMGLGCGNPVALASLAPGEVVMDLGSGGGIDCFLAAKAVGPEGMVIGVDMTPEMVDLARKNARKGNFANVEFRLGEIENLPAADSSVDVVISNCVVNLSPDKGRTFAEAFRVLRPGGRLMVSDMVLTGELPREVRESVRSYVSCLSGAVLKDEYLKAISSAGFTEVRVEGEQHFTEEMVPQETLEGAGISRDAARQALASVASIQVSALKPDTNQDPGKR